MPVALSVHAKEESTYIVTATFTDENGVAVVPVSIKWTLTDTAGIVINGKLDVVVPVPAASVDILLQGLDLAILVTDISSNPTRIITVEATYNSALGLGLPLHGDAEFVVDGMIGIP